MTLPATKTSYHGLVHGGSGPGWVVQPGLSGAARSSECEAISTYHLRAGYCPIFPGFKLSGNDMTRRGKPRCEFVVREKIGWGAEATVWLVQDAQGKYFVLKALRGAIEHIDTGEFEIMNELGRLSAAFLHEPEGVVEKYLCLVMPPLGDRLYAVSPVASSAPSIATFIRTPWDQLLDLHDRGICHGDISPGNVVLGLADDALTDESLRATFGSNQVIPVFLRKKTSGGGYADHIVQTPAFMPAFLVRRGGGGAMKSNKDDLSLARIIDFGRAFKGPSKLGIFGTPGYTAPELDTDREVAHAILCTNTPTQGSDLWSLGCTLVYALTGAHYFPGPSEKTDVRNRVKSYLEQPTPRQQVGALSQFLGYNEGISSDWELHALVTNVLHAMIRPDPAERSHDAIERNIRALEWYARASTQSYYARILARETHRYVGFLRDVVPAVLRWVASLRERAYSSRPGALLAWPGWRMLLSKILVAGLESWMARLGRV